MLRYAIHKRTSCITKHVFVGTYFGPTARISDGYVKGNGSVRGVCPAEVFHDNGNQPMGPGQSRAMFVARVIVGQYVQGAGGLKKPPAMPGKPGRCYDSCVDNPNNPGMFIVFERTQTYPEYIIEYT